MLGGRLLGRIATIVTPHTIIRWHRKLISILLARKQRPEFAPK